MAGRTERYRSRTKAHAKPSSATSTLEALRVAAAAREKERLHRKREREVRDLLDRVVQQGAANGIAGVPLPQRPPWQIGDFKREWDQARRRIIYRDATGAEAFSVSRHLVSGPGLQRDDVFRAGLVVAGAPRTRSASNSPRPYIPPRSAPRSP